MSELNQWEKQLESWTPRRPSAELEKRLFSRETVPSTQHVLKAPGWFWLAPATCVFLLFASMGLTRHGNTTGGMTTGGSNILASISQPYGISDARCQEWNRWEAVTFDWTKPGSSLSITGSFPILKALLKTNE